MSCCTTQNAYTELIRCPIQVARCSLSLTYRRQYALKPEVVSQPRQVLGVGFQWVGSGGPALLQDAHLFVGRDSANFPIFCFSSFSITILRAAPVVCLSISLLLVCLRAVPFFFSFSFPFKMASSSWQTRLVTVYSSFLILAGIFVFISRLGGDFAPFAASSPQPLEPASSRLTLNVVLSSNSLPSSSLTCGDGTHVEERKAWQAAHAKYAGLRDDKFTSVKDRHPSG